MIRKRTWAAAVTVAAVVVGGAFAAEEDRVAELEKQIRALQGRVAAIKTDAPASDVAEIERQIEVLAKEVESLKLGEVASDTASEGRYGLGPSASKVYGIQRGVSVGGYGEALYSNPSSSLEDGTPSGADASVDLLRLVLYFGAKFNDKILFNSEIEYEHVTTGEGDEERGEVTVEFAYLDFLVHPAVNVRAGLVLAPMGFINERHEPPTYFTTRRPLVETRIIPTTWTEAGAGVFGEIGPRVSYRAYVTSGLAAAEGTSSGAEGFTAEGIRDGRSKGGQASAEKLALTGRIDGEPFAGLTLGASFYTVDAGQNIDFAGGTLSARTTVWDAHAEYRWRGLQARALYAATSIDNVEDINLAQGFTGAESVGSDQSGWYVEAGYDVLSHFGNSRHELSPFFQYEQLDTQDEVPAGFAADPANDIDELTIGLRWKPIDNVAVKVDWTQQETGARTGRDEINLSLGFMF